MRRTKWLLSGFFVTACIFFSCISTSVASGTDGRELYMTHCKICHGENGVPTDLGEGLGARKFSDPEWQAKVTDEQIIKQIMEGTPDKMFPFKDKLSKEEIEALVPVVRSFGKQE